MYLKNIILTGLLLFIFVIPVAFAENSCIECHRNLTEPVMLNDYQQWMQSKHYGANITCDNCHGGNTSSNIKETSHIGVVGPDDPNSTVSFTNLPETCGRCHIDELIQFKDSPHYKKLKPFKQLPTCYTCHLPHIFNVLNSTEFHDFCTKCHNPEMSIAPANIPDDAILAIENANKFKKELKLAQDAISDAKKQGQNVSIAENDLLVAVSIQESLPKLWHSFNIPHFNEVVDSGIRIAIQAQLDTGLAAPRSPGFALVFSLAGIIAVYLLTRRK